MRRAFTGILVTIAVTALATLAGCASQGFNRGELSKQVGVEKPTFDEAKIKAAYEKKPNLPKPFRLGVYFKAPITGNRAEAAWRWTEEDKTQLEELGTELKSEGLVSEIFPILNSLLKDEDLKSIRYAGAQQHADAVLIVSGAGEIDRYINKLGWTYALVAPAFFAPGSQADALFMSSASLWDVKNEFLYAGAETEGTAKKTYIAAFGPTDKELLHEAKTDALKRMALELKKMLKGSKT